MEAQSRQSSTEFAEAAKTRPFANPTEPGLGLRFHATRPWPQVPNPNNPATSKETGGATMDLHSDCKSMKWLQNQ